MNITADTVALFHYTLRDAEGKELETSRGGDPSAYLHGANNIIPGREKAMEGTAAGDVFTADVAPEDAYGLPDPKRRSMRSSMISTMRPRTATKIATSAI